MLIELPISLSKRGYSRSKYQTIEHISTIKYLHRRNDKFNDVNNKALSQLHGYRVFQNALNPGHYFLFVVTKTIVPLPLHPENLVNFSLQ